MLPAARFKHVSGSLRGARSRSRALLALVIGSLIATLLLHVSRAAAQEASALRNRVVLLGAKNPTDAAALWSSTRAQLSDLEVERIEEQGTDTTLEDSARRARLEADRHGALAVVWFDTDEGVVTVFLFEARGRRLRARRVLVSGTAEAAAEEVGVVVRSAISALLEGAEVSMPEIPVPSAPAPPPPEPRAPPPPAREHLRLSVGYLGTLYSLGAAWQNGAAASISLHPGESPWFVELGYAFLPPLELSAPGVKSELLRHPSEIGLGLELGIGRFRVATEALFIVDFVSRRTTRADEPLARAPSETRTLYAGSLRLRGSLPLGEGFALYAAFGAEFLLNRFDHVVLGSDSPEPSITQLAARPRGDAGLSYALF
jgi:hypothetical protein